MFFLPLDITQAKKSPVRRVTTPKTAKVGTRNKYNKSPKNNKNQSSTNDSNYFYKPNRNEEISTSNNETRSNFSSHASTHAPFSSKQENEQEKEELISYWTEEAVIQNTDLSNPKISCKIKPEILPDLIKNLQSVRDACIVDGRGELSCQADAALTACKNLYKENLVNEKSNNQSQNIQKRIDQAKQELSELQERITVQEANMANEFQRQNRKLKEKHKKEIKSLKVEWHVEDAEVPESSNNDNESYLESNCYDSMYPTAVNKNLKSTKNNDKYNIYVDDDDEKVSANKNKKNNNNYDDFLDNEYLNNFEDNHTNKNANSENADLGNSTKNESKKRHKKIKKKKSKKTNSKMKNKENNELNDALNDFTSNLLEMHNEDNKSVNSETADESDMENKKSDDSQDEGDDNNKAVNNDLSKKVNNAFMKLNKDESENSEDNKASVDDVEREESKNESEVSDQSNKDDDNDLSIQINNAFMLLNKDESENSGDDKDSSVDDVEREESENESQSDIRSDSEIMNDESSIHASESFNVDEHSKSYSDEISNEEDSTFLDDENENEMENGMENEMENEMENGMENEMENEISDVYSSKQSISSNKNDEFDNKSKNSNSIKNDKIFKRFFTGEYNPIFQSSSSDFSVDDSVNVPKANDKYSNESENLSNDSKKEINYNYSESNDNINEEIESKSKQSNSSSKPPQANDKKPKQKRNMTDLEIIRAPITHFVKKSQLNNRVDLKSSNYKKEKRLRHYSKASSELRVLRRQAAFYLSEGKVEEARLIQQRADAIEKEEILSNSLQMQKDYEKKLESLMKKQQDEEENLKKLQNIKRAEYEKAKQEELGIFQRRIEKLENEMKIASNKERTNALFQRSSNLQKSSLGSRSKLKSNRNDLTSEEKMANIKEPKEEYFYDNYDQQFNHHHHQKANHQSHEMNDFPHESNEEFNSIENQKLDMKHSLNRNAKRKPNDNSGLNRYNFYTFASKINKNASQNLNQNLNQSLKTQLNLNVNKSLDSMNQSHPLAKRRKYPTAVSMPLTSRRQVKPGELCRLKLQPLDASKEAKKIIKSTEKSMRLNKDYI